MLFSLNFIKRFVLIKKSPKELASLLTMAGLEVENIEEKNGDYIFSIEITSNRYDWLSFLGLAREIATILDEKLTIKLPNIKNEKEIYEKKVIIENKDDCPLYVGRIIKNVKVKESPSWLKELLLNCGFNTVNNIVDITNFCMLKWGNPLHAFDLDKIKGHIFIRRAKEGEKFLGIDGKERILSLENLVIADEEKVIALAGVMGAKNTEITLHTKNIFLEAAIFSPVVIRRSRRKVGLETESSYRFERSVNEFGLENSSKEAVLLIEDLAEGEYVGKKEINFLPKQKSLNLRFNIEKMENYLGGKIPFVKAKKILKNLGFKMKKVSSKKLIVSIPSFRTDIKKEVDLYEEIARIYGYDKIPPKLDYFFVQTNKDDFFTFKKEVRDFLITLQLKEIISYSLVAEEELIKLGDNNFIKLTNPLRQQENVLRTSLLVSLIKTVRFNLNRNFRDLSFFEIANIYKKEKDVFYETTHLAFCLSGKKEKIFFLKGIIELLFKKFNLEINFEKMSLKNFSNALKIFNRDNFLGFLGKLNEDIKKYFDLKEDIYFSELNLDLIYKLKKEKKFIPFSVFPYIYRDISIALNKTKNFLLIEKEIKENAKFLDSFSVIDIYEGKNEYKDYNLFTLRIFYQSKERTLTSQEVDGFHNELREKLSQLEGVILR